LDWIGDWIVLSPPSSFFHFYICILKKDESHPGKVVERSWYERNKHIFPASRWEVYDPAKNYGGYTIAGKIVTTKNK